MRPGGHPDVAVGRTYVRTHIRVLRIDQESVFIHGYCFFPLFVAAEQAVLSGLQQSCANILS